MSRGETILLKEKIILLLVGITLESGSKTNYMEDITQPLVLAMFLMEKAIMLWEDRINCMVIIIMLKVKIIL